jgi:hypothetical protein
MKQPLLPPTCCGVRCRLRSLRYACLLPFVPSCTACSCVAGLNAKSNARQARGDTRGKRRAVRRGGKRGATMRGAPLPHFALIAVPCLCVVVAGSVGNSGCWAVRLALQRRGDPPAKLVQLQARQGNAKAKAEEKGKRRERNGWMAHALLFPPLRSHSVSVPLLRVASPSAVVCRCCRLLPAAAVAVVPSPPWVRCFRQRRCRATLSATMCVDRGWRKSTSTTPCKCQSLSVPPLGHQHPCPCSANQQCCCCRSRWQPRADLAGCFRGAS